MIKIYNFKKASINYLMNEIFNILITRGVAKYNILRFLVYTVARKLRTNAT